jgi:hypothetical protein
VTTGAAAALTALADALPPCDALNLGYAVLVDGEVSAAAMERAIADVLRADPLLAGPWLWRAGRAGRDQFAALAAEHLTAPLTPECPVRAALWSASAASHCLLIAVHHLVADGVVLDRLATDLARRLDGQDIPPVAFAPPRSLVAPPSGDAPGLPLAPAPPSVRASCRTVVFSDHLSRRFCELTRSWRATPFAGAVTCVAAAIAAWTGREDVGVTIPIAGRHSSAAVRAPGPWYDYSHVRVRVAPDDPLRATLLDVSERLLRHLAGDGRWAADRHDESGPELLVVYDRHPLSNLRIPGCRVCPVSVERHPRRADGTREYLVATDADIVAFFREQSASIGLSLFTKVARVPEATAGWLLDAIVDAVGSLCEGGQQPFERTDSRPDTDSPDAAPAAWPEPSLSELPLVDAVSPVFRVRAETLAAFARDARCTLEEWGRPSWLRPC